MAGFYVPTLPERRAHLMIMVKEPHAGRVKTRLGNEIGMVPAAWWFRHQSARLIRRLAGDRRWRTWLAVSPDAEGLASRIWPAGLARIGQGHGDLGMRMAGIFQRLPPGPAVIIGADIPAIAPGHIAHAFRALGDHPACIGPTFDGGYWLVGLRRTAREPAGLFANVRWSSADTLQDTLAALPAPVARIERLRDVDTAADLAAFTHDAPRRHVLPPKA